MHDDAIRQAVRSQYGAALAMLRATIAQCPDLLWDDPADKNRFWHVAYHALFYAHLYLSPSLDDFVAWAGHRAGYERMETPPAPPYTQADLLDFLAECEAHAARHLATLDFAAPSGFHWLPMNKLELQLYNIRHIQTHAGELAERLSQRAGIDVGWVSMGA
jgi:hypothetical protein